MFTIGFDGTFTVGDRTFAGTGGRSWTKADSVTRFDALTILPLR